MGKSGVFFQVNSTKASAGERRNLEISLLTGGFDRAYAFGLSKALVSRGVLLEVIGSDDLDRPEMYITPALKFRNLQRNPRDHVSLARRAARVLAFYIRLLSYVPTSKPKLFHILWNNKLQLFDRTILMLYYKLLGKKIVFTAHNVNAGQRDSNDSFLNRVTLKIQYRLVDHIFVHTNKMKTELLSDFGVHEKTVTVIPYGINDAVPDTALTSAEAKRRFAIRENERVILFFGNIGPYKGVEYLIAAFKRFVHKGNYRLIIAGKPRGKCEQYIGDILKALKSDDMRKYVTATIEYVSDEDTEVYFKAADVLVLPYTHIYQSGVLFLGYGFGLPVIATDVGSLGDDIVRGKTGFLCRPCDPVDLAQTIEMYFESDLFRDLAKRRGEIKDYAKTRHSWDSVGEITRDVYATLLKS